MNVPMQVASQAEKDTQSGPEWGVFYIHALKRILEAKSTSPYACLLGPSVRVHPSWGNGTKPPGILGVNGHRNGVVREVNTLGFSFIFVR